MKVNIDAAKPTTRRPGPKSRLDSFEGPPSSLAPSSTEFLDDPLWFERYGGFIVRGIADDERCGIDLRVNEAMKQRIRRNLEKPMVGKTSFHDHFVSHLGSTQKIPPFPLEGRYKWARLISKSLMGAAKKDRALVSSAVSAYAHGVRKSDKLLVLATASHARFGRELIDLVRLLDLRWLRWRFVTFDTGRKHQRMITQMWARALKLPANTPVHAITAKNKSNEKSYLNHIAVEVIEQHRDLKEVSSNFYSVMLFARVVEMWHLA